MCSISDSNLHSMMPLHGDVPNRTKCISLESTLPLTTDHSIWHLNHSTCFYA